MELVDHDQKLVPSYLYVNGNRWDTRKKPTASKKIGGVFVVARREISVKYLSSVVLAEGGRAQHMFWLIHRFLFFIHLLRIYDFSCMEYCIHHRASQKLFYKENLQLFIKENMREMYLFFLPSVSTAAADIFSAMPEFKVNDRPSLLVCSYIYYVYKVHIYIYITYRRSELSEPEFIHSQLNLYT